MRSSRKNKQLKKGVKMFMVIFLIIAIFFGVYYLLNNIIQTEKYEDAYLSSDTDVVTVYDKDYKEVLTLYRGIKVSNTSSVVKDSKGTIYTKIKYKGENYLVKKENITNNKNKIVMETIMYVRTGVTVFKEASSSKILSFIKKGEKLDIIGYDKIDDKGKVNRYKIKYNDIEGYVYSKYLVNNENDSKALYDSNGLQEYLSDMGNSLGGGTAINLDYYPYEKPKFEDNVMPEEARTLYINAAAVKDIDSYIEFAKNNNINAFVIDIKDNTTPAYNSPIMEQYSKTNFDHALNEYNDYKSYVKQALDAGIYVIGRITTFKDSYYVTDHPESAIKNSSGKPFSHNGSYWPSAYNRGVWEFAVELAKEAVTEIGFNEIQFDYVRFPDRTTLLEKNGTINLGNTYNEEKAGALQTFVMYACDEIHSVGAYVSIDVFGESASNYVTAYGQFWPALSNVADVMSGMPYPDHFNAHEYGIKEIVWTVPYKLLNEWGKTVASKQNIIPTPAIVRTWIQTYNTVKTPSVVYDATKISEQIQALYDNELTGGYMTWNSGSNISKYKEVSAAFKKEYK